jgi:hypothetical protein
MLFACYIPNATNTPSEYVMLIAFPLQQWLRERSSLLRLKCIARPVTRNTGRENKSIANEEQFRYGLRSSGMTLCHCVMGSRLFEPT